MASSAAPCCPGRPVVASAARPAIPFSHSAARFATWPTTAWRGKAFTSGFLMNYQLGSSCVREAGFSGALQSHALGGDIYDEDQGEAVRASCALMKRIRSCTTVNQLSRAVFYGCKSGVLDSISASFALSRLAKIAKGKLLMRGGGPEATDLLQEHLMNNIGVYSARSLATSVHSLAKLGVRDEDLFTTAARQVLRHTAEYKPQEVSMTLWGFAKAGQVVPELFQALGRQVVNKALFFKPQELSMAVWAYASAGIAAPTLFMTVEHEVVEKLRFFKPQEVSNIVWAFATASHKAPELFAAAEEWMMCNTASLNAADLSMALWGFAKAGEGSPTFYRTMSTAAAGCVSKFTPAGAASLLWALASTGHASQELLAAFDDVLQRDLNGKLKPRELCTIVWAYSSMGHQCQLVERLLEIAPSMTDRFEPRDISMLLSSCVRLGLVEPVDGCGGELLDGLAARAAIVVADFQPVDLSLALWAFANLGNRSSALPVFVEAAPLVASAALTLPLKNLAMVAWAYGLCQSRVRGCRDGEQEPTWEDGQRPFSSVFEALGPLVVDSAAQMSAQGLVLVVQGFARAQHYSVEVFAAVELQVLARRVDAFTPQAQAQLLLAFAAVKDPGVSLFDAMEERVLHQIDSFSAQGLANVLYAYARMNYHSPRLFSAAERQAVHRTAEFGTMDVSTLLWAFAKQGCGAERLFQMLGPRTRELLGSLSGRDISSILWAHAMADVQNAELCLELVEAAAALRTPLHPRDLLHAVWACSHMRSDASGIDTAALAHESEANGGRQGQQPLSKPSALLRERLLTALAPAVERTAAAGELRQRLVALDLRQVVATYSTLVGDPEVVAGVLQALKPAVALSLTQGHTSPDDEAFIRKAYTSYAPQLGRGSRLELTPSNT
eukprot:CAMPEP_0117650310 /NCGR_PEP_ID=MMETSP0804-20121206/1472_1 /TAXON_ID=1074897 /ORGANISM="Tetraselmis astigmatica, Strain CCMP880" /LENGTH=895 /DNA_ID=CAMNT_0005456175 /DNA_START=32 /DNA_END=2720 /DNA_ORIENTATION=+